jgi:hypothetical protein
MSPDGEDLLPKSHSSCDKQGTSSAANNCADPYQHLEEEQLATILCSLRSNSCESIIDSHSNVDHNYGQEPLAQEPNLLIIPRKRRTKTSHDSPEAKRFKQAVIPGHHESTWRTEKYIDPLRKEVHDLKWSFSEPTGIQQESAKLATYGKGKEKQTESSDNRNSLEISNQANRVSSEASAEQSSPRRSISESISKVNSNSGQEPLAQDLLAINIPRKPRTNTSKKSPTANKVIEGDIHRMHSTPSSSISESFLKANTNHGDIPLAQQLFPINISRKRRTNIWNKSSTGKKFKTNIEDIPRSLDPIITNERLIDRLREEVPGVNQASSISKPRSNLNSNSRKEPLAQALFPINMSTKRRTVSLNRISAPEKVLNDVIPRNGHDPNL